MNFDERIELFLKKRLSKEEELEFIAELENNPALLERAKTLALFLDEIKVLRNERDANVINEISKLNKEEYQARIWTNDRMSHFDELTNRFLKKQLTKEEEDQYISKLNEIPSLRKRAQIIALTVQQIDDISKETSQKLIATISKESEVEFRRATLLPPKRIALWPRLSRYAVAASIALILGIGGYKYYQYEQIVSLGIEYYQPMDENFRSSSDVTINELTKVFKNIEFGKNLTTSINQLKDYYALSRSDEYNDYSLYSTDIAWNLAIAYLKDNNAKEAIKILEEIKKEHDGKAIATKAEELIMKIEDIL